MSTLSPTRVVVDNWSLELVCQLLKGNLAYPTVPNPKSRVSPLSSFSFPYLEDNGVDKLLFHEKVVSLLNLLDILVLNDEILYDPEWSNYWKEFDTLNPIRHILSEVRLSSVTKNKLSKPPDHIQTWFRMSNRLNSFEVDNRVINDMVEGGALYYYNLANLLGVYYWPSPMRAHFLKQNAFASNNNEFILLFKEFIDNQIREAINTALLDIGLSEKAFLFSGIGSAVLSNCESSNSILATAMQFRESKECTALREWLRQLNVALGTGNIAKIAGAIKDVRESMENVQKKLGIKTENKSSVELQIGLSPSLSLDTDFFTSKLDSIKPKPLHLVFLREHFKRCLTDVNIMKYINRIFFN